MTGMTGTTGVTGVTGTTGPIGPTGPSEPVKGILQYSTALTSGQGTTLYLTGTQSLLLASRTTAFTSGGGTDAIGPGNNHILFDVTTLTLAGGATSATASITGTLISEVTGVPTTTTETIVFSSTGTYQTIGKWLAVTAISFTDVASIAYSVTDLGYVDFQNTDVKITGYRCEVLGDSSSGGDGDITLELVTISQSGSATTIDTIENIKIDGTTDTITDTQRGTRGFTMPSGNLWPTNSNFVLKQSDFDTYFTSDENVINGASNGGIIARVSSTNTFGGANAARYVALTINYEHI
jgi:hypothetical protein